MLSTTYTGNYTNTAVPMKIMATVLCCIAYQLHVATRKMDVWYA